MEGRFSDGRISSRNFFSETKLQPGVDSARSKALSNSASAGCTYTPGPLVLCEASWRVVFGRDTTSAWCGVFDALVSAIEGSSQNSMRSDSGTQVSAAALLRFLRPSAFRRETRNRKLSGIE